MVFTMPSNVRATLYGATNPCAAGEIYGEHSREVALLRNFRDTVLSKSAAGRQLINLYYEVSPVIITAMEEDESVTKALKTLIDGIVPLLALLAH